MLFDTNNSATILGAITAHRQNKKEENDYFNVLSQYENNPDAFLTDDISKIADVSDAVKDSLTSIQEEAKNTGKTGVQALQQIQVAMGDTAKKGTKLGASIKNFGKSLLSGLVSGVIMWGLTTAVDNIAKYIDKKLNPSKYIQKAAKKAREEIANIKTELQNTVDSVDNVKQHYAELAQEVNHLGTVAQNQGTLSNDEYKEFLDISNQLAELFPTLTKGYDENGNAILDLSGDVDTIVGSLERLVEIEREAANAEIAEKLPKDWAGYADDISKYEEKITKAEKRLQALQTFLNGGTFNDLDTEDINYVSKTIQTAAKTKGLKDPLGDGVYQNEDRILDMIKLNPEDTEALLTQIRTAENRISREIDNYNSTIEKKTIDMYNNLSTQLLNGDYYNDLSEEMQKIYQGFVFNYDYKSLAVAFPNKGDFTQALDKVEGDLREVFDKVSSDPSTFQEYYDKIFAIDTSSGVFAENIEKIKEYIRQLAELFDVDYNLLAKILGFGDIDTDINKVKDAFVRNNSTGKAVYDENLGYAVYDNNTDVGKAESQAKKEYDAFVDSLSKEDFDFWKNALDNGKIPQDVLHRGEQGLKDYLEELRKIANKNPIFSATSYVDNMKDVRSAVGSLNDLYWKTVEKNPDTTYDESNIFGIADSDMIESVESAFGGFDEDSKVTKALKNFEDTLVRFPGDSERAHEAMNELVTAYIDQTGILDDLTEATAKQAEAELTEIGITNAHDVVQDRLNKTDKETIKLYSKLKDGVNAYYKAIENGGNGVNELQDIADKLNEMYTFQDADGNNIQLFNVDNVKENIDLINEGLDETCDHMTEIEKLAIQEYLLKVSSEFEDEETRNKINQLSADIDNMDLGTVEIGATMNTGPVVAALNEIYKTGKYTFEEFSKRISTITGGKLKANIKWNTSAINSVMKYFKGNTVKGREFINSHMDEFMIPDEISYTYMGGGSGTTANYAPPASSGSSSGGGGGGGGGSEPNKPKEESEETFDWIEVAIQRIEEDVSRLDKVIDNTYISWGERNTALADEIDTLADEYEALGMASDEYFRNANEVKVNGGKGLNDDDYGENDELVKAHDQELLDEANRLWATGEYQKKVQEGLLTGDDIEKISNHFLADTIKEYQEWYNKGIEKKDAQYDVKLKISGDYEKQFNNVKEEYSELIQYITDQADVIDEKINRTEKRGYFVSKSYYEDLKALEAQRYSKLDAEYEDLIKKRDEAVASGAVEEGSEAWNKMNQEINATNLELEKSKTQMVEYNNTIRQLDWDFFDWVEERISRINSEASFLVDLMSNDQLYNENGTMNDLGHATNAMYAVQYETYMRQAKDYAEERKKLEKDLANDPNNKDLIARYEELVDKEQEAIKGAEQVKDSVKSFVEQGIQKFLNKLQELISDYKEALHDAKDFYDYQKNIANQVKNIGNLRKQLLAYEGDDSEETRATVQKLRSQLEDAETQLKETQWDKYISETESFLDDMYTNMEETLMARLDDVDQLMHDMIDVANANADKVQETIAQETSKVGYNLSDTFDKVINGDESRLVTDLNKGFADVNTALTNVQSVIEQIKNFAAAMVENGKANVDTVPETDDKGTTGGVPQSKGGNGGGDGSGGNNGNNNTNGSGNGDNKGGNDNGKGDSKLTDEDYYGVALAIVNGNYGWGTGEDRFKKLREKGFDDDKVQDIVNQLFEDGYINSGAWVGKYCGITDLSKYAYAKYAKGSKRITHDQMAITQEAGAEMIFRSNDGSLLMPLGTGDKVFTAQMTDNLWELAKGKFTTAVPKSTGGNTINNTNAINITLPNVTNYEQFKTQLQNDPKMTAFIQQITLGEVSNGVKLNKKKY